MRYAREHDGMYLSDKQIVTVGIDNSSVDDGQLITTEDLGLMLKDWPSYVETFCAAEIASQVSPG